MFKPCFPIFEDHLLCEFSDFTIPKGFSDTPKSVFVRGRVCFFFVRIFDEVFVRKFIEFQVLDLSSGGVSAFEYFSQLVLKGEQCLSSAFCILGDFPYSFPLPLVVNIPPVQTLFCPLR
jgi:hypothetical protein